MSYYLPIMINGRRMEFLKLLRQGEEEHAPISTKRFVIVNQNSPTILSIENREATLISSKKRGYNVDLGKLNYEISKDEISQDGRGSNNSISLQKYTITLQKGTGNEKANKENANSGGPLIATQGKILISDAYKHSVVQWDSTKGSGNYELELVISYEEYKCSIIVYLCESSQVKTVAMDFGSEATQVRRDTSMNRNMNLLEAYKEFRGDSQSEGSPNDDKEKSQSIAFPSDDKDFYQYGPQNPGLFKSIIYLNVNPEQIKYGEKPQVDNSKMYVLPLMYPALYNEIKDSRYLLPNLKLLDLYGCLLPGTRLMVQKDKCDIEPAGAYVLGDKGIYAGTLRIVISQFLHCIFKSFDVDCYLRLVFLAPNVYRQKKLADIMLGIYADFDIIKKNNLYPHVKGLEVQFLSESDASFLGWVVQHPGGQTFPNGYILTIDAGKGTTDFSIIKQNGRNLTNYTSLYRDGIPASGNYITYAFYETLSEISNKKGWKLNEKLIKAVNENPSEAKRFVDYLDEFKFNYVNNDNCAPFDGENISSPTELGNINDAIERYLNDCRQRSVKPRIKGSEEFVVKAIGELVGEICKSLDNYTKSEQGVEFERLVLSGRAFLFQPLRDRLVAELKKAELIQGDNQVLFSKEGDSSKTECLKGALIMMDMFDVNLNSGMVGSPILETPSSPRKPRWLCANNQGNKVVKVSKDFYYRGMGITKAHQIVRIGRNVMTPRGRGPVDFKNSMLFFVGDDYLVQTSKSCFCFENVDGRGGGDLDEVVKRSLFPFVVDSILQDKIASETNVQNADTQNGNQVQAPNLRQKDGKEREETSGAGTMD